MTAERAATTEQHLGEVARGAGLGLIGSAVSAVTTFALVLVVARVSSTAVSGVFFASTAVFLILLGLTGLGVEAGLARLGVRLARAGEHARLRALFSHVGRVVVAVAAVTTLLVLAVAGSVDTLLGWGEDGAAVLRVVALALPFAVAAEWAQATTRAFGRMQETVWLDRTARPLVQVVAVGVAGGLGAGAPGLALAWVSCYPLVALASFLSARRYLRSRFPTSASEGPGAPVREFWSFTWPRALSVVARLSVQKVDVVLVAALLSPQDAALYTVATRFVALGQALSMAVNQVLQARFATLLLEGSPVALGQVFRTSTAWGMLLAWPLYLAVGVVPAGYLALFGAEYVGTGGEQVVLVMTLALLLASATGPIDVLLVMAGRSVTSMVNAWVALLVDVVLCLVLLPWVGVVGAALAWAAAVLSKSVLAVVQVHAEVRVTPVSGTVALAALVPVVSVAAPVLVLTRLEVPWLLAVAVAVPCFGAAVLALRRRLGVDVLLTALREKRR